MVHDLLGTEIGWMSKKADTTILKSNIIQIIFMIKAIIEAIAKNGLQCGEKNNYNEAQMKYILEKELNPKLPKGSRFNVKENGDVEFVQETRRPDVVDTTKGGKPLSKAPSSDTIDRGTTVSTAIKNCFKSVSAEELKNVQSWISDFEKGMV
jgi:hypothetical protein